VFCYSLTGYCRRDHALFFVYIHSPVGGANWSRGHVLRCGRHTHRSALALHSVAELNASERGCVWSLQRNALLTM